MWIQREIELFLKELAYKRPSIIVTGARQTGKTSLLKHVFPSYHYITLDIPLYAEEAEESGESFLNRHKKPVIVDEVQYAPRLLRHIKHSIDQNRDENGQYLLTGSQKFSLMEKVTESLAGRCAILTCYSLSAREYETWRQKSLVQDTLLEWIWMGGYPELHAKALDPEQFYGNYLATYLERDVLQILQVQNLRDFDRFLRLCAIRSGQLLSLSTLASEIGISPNTAKSWISILETSGIIYLLEPYYQNLGKRIVKSPKLYFMDTGLACYLVGIRSVEDLKRSQLLGFFFETHVLGQLIRHYANQGKRPEFYFYRDHYGNEVDFLVPVGNVFQLMECKWAENPSLDVKGFRELERLVGTERILSKSIITPSPGTRKMKENIIIEDSVHFQKLT